MAFTLPARRFGAEWVHELDTFDLALEPAAQRWPSRGEVPGARAVDEAAAARLMPKIAFIGAGSTVFARNLVGDILEPARSCATRRRSR